jgi:hypothetical protein
MAQPIGRLGSCSNLESIGYPFQRHCRLVPLTLIGDPFIVLAASKLPAQNQLHPHTDEAPQM